MILKIEFEHGWWYFADVKEVQVHGGTMYYKPPKKGSLVGSVQRACTEATKDEDIQCMSDYTHILVTYVNVSPRTVKTLSVWMKDGSHKIVLFDTVAYLVSESGVTVDKIVV